MKVIIAQLPSNLAVRGAALLGENSTTGHNIWQWTLVRPSELRMNPLYSKVENIPN